MSRLSGEIIEKIFPSGFSLPGYDGGALSAGAYIPYVQDSEGVNPVVEWQDHWSPNDLFLLIGIYVVNESVGEPDVISTAPYSTFYSNGTAPVLDPVAGTGINIYIAANGNNTTASFSKFAVRIKRIPADAI